MTASTLAGSNASATPLRILTLNLWHGMAPTSLVRFEPVEPPSRRDERELLQIQTVARANADVGFFQECNEALVRAPLLARTTAAEFAYQPDAVGVKLFGYGVPMRMNGGLVTTMRTSMSPRRIGSLSLDHPRFHLVHARASLQVREERFALFGEIVLPDHRRVLLVNLHAHDGFEFTTALAGRFETLFGTLGLSESIKARVRRRLGAGNARRSTEFQNVLARIERAAPEYDAVVLAGDFNASPGSEVDRLAVDSGFHDAWAEVNANKPGFTFDPVENSVNHHLSDAKPNISFARLGLSTAAVNALTEEVRRAEAAPRRLDYLYVKSLRARVTVRAAKLVGRPGSDGLAPSDHFGILADLEID